MTTVAEWTRLVVVVVALLFAVVAADWVSGTCLMATAWMWRKPRRATRRSDALTSFGPTPLADEIEEWLRHS